MNGSTRRARRDGTVFIQPRANGTDGPRSGTDPAGWLARLADGPFAGLAVAAEHRFEDLHGLVLAAGLPGRRAVCLEAVADLPAARLEVLRAERTRLALAMRRGAAFGAFASVAGLALLETLF